MQENEILTDYINQKRNYNIIYNYYPGNPGKVKIVCADVVISFEIKLPKWKQRDSQCPEIKKEWDSFVNRLTKHENGHIGYLKNDLSNFHKVIVDKSLFL